MRRLLNLKKLPRIFNAFWLNGEGVERSCRLVMDATFPPLSSCIAQLASDLVTAIEVVVI